MKNGTHIAQHMVSIRVYEDIVVKHERCQGWIVFEQCIRQSIGISILLDLVDQCSDVSPHAFSSNWGILIAHFFLDVPAFHMRAVWIGHADSHLDLFCLDAPNNSIDDVFLPD